MSMTVTTIRRFDVITTVDGNGELHSENNKPSYINGGVKAWHFHGKLHRENGPAQVIIGSNGEINESYYIYGKYISVTSVQDEEFQCELQDWKESYVKKVMDE